MWSEAIFVGGGRKCAGKFWNCWPRWVGCILENGDECGSEHTIWWRHQPGSPQLTRSSKPVRTHPVPTVTRVITRSSARKEPPEIPWWVGLVRIYCAKLRHSFSVVRGRVLGFLDFGFVDFRGLHYVFYGILGFFSRWSVVLGLQMLFPLLFFLFLFGRRMLPLCFWFWSLFSRSLLQLVGGWSSLCLLYGHCLVWSGCFAVCPGLLLLLVPPVQWFLFLCRCCRFDLLCRVLWRPSFHSHCSTWSIGSVVIILINHCSPLVSRQKCC